ncbi:MAG: hypothetical protein AAGN66_00125 [Acidobacteriota bacterium]
MSSAPSTSPAATMDAAPQGGPDAVDWSLVRRQITGILRLEIRKNLLSRRAFVLYFLALAPVGLMTLWALFASPTEYISGPIEASRVFALTYVGYLGTSIFLSCVILFMSLFRAEILERSLHYYLLTPVRREALVVGKYVSALASIAAVYGVSTLLLYVITMSPWGLGEASRFLFQGPGLSNLLSYVGISILACVGYGALFLLAGLVFRNPVITAALIWGWEFINFLLPAWLKKISVVFYLKSLLPIPLSEGQFSVMADPIPAWISVPGLMLFTALLLILACWRMRRMEVTYAGDD